MLNFFSRKESPPPPPKTKVTMAGNTEICHWENLVGPLLVHKYQETFPEHEIGGENFSNATPSLTLNATHRRVTLLPYPSPICSLISCCRAQATGQAFDRL